MADHASVATAGTPPHDVVLAPPHACPATLVRTPGLLPITALPLGPSQVAFNSQILLQNGSVFCEYSANSRAALSTEEIAFEGWRRVMSAAGACVWTRQPSGRSLCCCQAPQQLRHCAESTRASSWMYPCSWVTCDAVQKRPFAAHRLEAHLPLHTAQGQGT